MKNVAMEKLLSCFVLAVLLLGLVIHQCPAQTKKEELEGTVTMSGAWALYPMAIRWAEEFQKLHPKVKIDIAAGGAGKGMADALANIADLGMVSRDIYPAEIEKGAWWVSVTKDAVVPTISSNNPFLKEILRKGITRETFIKIWITGEKKNWGEIIAQKTPHQIHVYTRSDACGAAQTWAEFLGKNQEDLLGVGVYGDPGLAEAVKRDALGIGFNNINYVYDAKTKKQVTGVTILPIDINNNGKIDKDEDFYKNRDEIVKAIAIGKYPSPPARDLHFVSQGKPQRKVVVEFITWVLTEGQKYVAESGYINLSDEKLKKGLDNLK
jgi:phosphate transport system substrate-binding protein